MFTKDSTKVRISKKLLKSLPKEVAARLQEWKDRGYVASVYKQVAEEGYKVYSSEGHEYFMLYNGQSRSLRMFNESPGEMGVCYDVNSHVTPPAGTWVCELSNWLMGKRCCTVTHITPKQIEA